MVNLEFQAANGTASWLNVEYAKEGFELNFVTGRRVKVEEGRLTYRMSQTGLIPGETYHIRVVPTVHLYNLLYRGIPSNTTTVIAPAPGRLSLCLVFKVRVRRSAWEFG